MKLKKRILENEFIKNLIKNSAGYSFENKILKIFFINDEINERLIKNRVPITIKDIKIKNNSVFIKF
jgi:hypothetical protein